MSAKKDCRTVEGTFLLRRFYNSAVIKPLRERPDKLVTAGAALVAGIATATAALVAATPAQHAHAHNDSHNAKNLAHRKPLLIIPTSPERWFTLNQLNLPGSTLTHPSSSSKDKSTLSEIFLSFFEGL